MIYIHTICYTVKYRVSAHYLVNAHPLLLADFRAQVIVPNKRVPSTFVPLKIRWSPFYCKRNRLPNVSAIYITTNGHAFIHTASNINSLPPSLLTMSEEMLYKLLVSSGLAMGLFSCSY